MVADLRWRERLWLFGGLDFGAPAMHRHGRIDRAHYPGVGGTPWFRSVDRLVVKERLTPACQWLARVLA